MINHLGVKPIAHAWQVELDTGLETGEAPFFGLGAQQSILPGMAGLMALALVEAERGDTLAPVVVAGGASPLWLAALLHERPNQAPFGSPSIIAAYTAPDPATHCATLTTYDTRRSVFRRRPAGLPPAFHPVAAPTTQAANTTLEMLPLTEAQATMAFGRDGWVAWAVIAAAVGLFVLALVA